MIRLWFAGVCQIILLCSVSLTAQVADSFSDGNFHADPRWWGDSARFSVTQDLQLRLTAPPETDAAWLVTASKSIHNATWQCYVRLDFNPSSSNYLRIYLASDSDKLTGALNGYYVRMGGTEDDLSLYRQDGLVSTRIIDGPDKLLDKNSVELILQATRDGAGLWTLSADTALDGTFLPMGTATDSTHAGSSCFGMACFYTATRSDKFYFDDFLVTGTELVDTLPPVIKDLKIDDPRTIRLIFTEALDSASAAGASNYFLDGGIGIPAQAGLDPDNKSAAVLLLNAPLHNKTGYKISVGGILDISGNLMIASELTFFYYVPEEGDVLIHEFMADPSPVVDLPDAEYIELYNAGDWDLNLEGWRIEDPTSAVQLPPGMLRAGEYLILCDGKFAQQFSVFGPVLGLAGFISLNNSGDLLRLVGAQGQVVHELEYDDDWYDDPQKSDGGWSIEMKSAGSRCRHPANWGASLNPMGGTPGRPNSFPHPADNTPPGISFVEIIDGNSLKVGFTEGLDPLTAQEPSSFSASGGLGLPESVEALSSDFATLALSFGQSFEIGELYRMVVLGIEDCFGNQSPKDEEALFLSPEPMAGADVVINEILFDPYSTGADFVEIFNRSGKIVDLRSLEILELGAADRQIKENARLTGSQRLLFPEEFAVLTEDPEKITKFYHCPAPETILTVDKMPNFPDDGGVVVIRRDSALILDEVHFRASWHYPLIGNPEGVSLERMRMHSPSQDSSNWMSAAALAGYATPGYRNSQYDDGMLAEGSWTVHPEVFSPDQDGHDDYLTINYRLEEPGYTGNIVVMDERGRITRRLVNTGLLANEGSMIWDGLKDDMQPAGIGVYLIWIEVFNMNGKVRRRVEKCVLAARLH